MSTQITPEQIQQSEERVRALQKALELAIDKDAARRQLEQAEIDHRALCQAQTAELQQMYLANFIGRMSR